MVGVRSNAYRALTEWGRIGSATWEPSETRDGKYYVSGDLTVKAGATLTIEPSTVVRVGPDHEGAGSDTARVEIIVEGRLEAIGTDEDPIVFESFVDTGASATDWVGIRFRPGSNAVLRNVIIRNASQDIDVDEFDISVAAWDETKTLYLNSDFGIIAGDTTIATSDSLFVLGDTDVVVKAGVGLDITVNGSLICKGSATKKPEFVSSNGNPRTWNLITLTSYSENNLFHNAIIQDALLAIRTYVPLTVDSCLIQDGTDGIQAYDDLTVRNTTIHTLIGNGVVLLDGDLIADNVTIHDAVNGIVQSTASSTGTIICTDSHLYDMDYYGVNVPSESDGVTIERTTVENTASGIRLLSQSVGATIDSCTIRKNDIGIEAVILDCAITDCVIDSNSTAGVYSILADPSIRGTTISNSAVGVSFYYYSEGTVTDATRVTDNATGIKCEVSSTPVVESTLIADNSVGIAVLTGVESDLGDASYEAPIQCARIWCQLRDRRSIHDNSSYDVVNSTGTNTIMAEGNWWGSGGPSPSEFSGAVDRHPYNCDDDPVPSSVVIIADTRPEASAPNRYQLSTNQPNPFNPVTMLRYDTPIGMSRGYCFFDVSGRRVRTLVAGNQSARASHSVTWTGTSTIAVRVCLK